MDQIARFTALADQADAFAASLRATVTDLAAQASSVAGIPVIGVIPSIGFCEPCVSSWPEQCPEGHVLNPPGPDHQTGWVDATPHRHTWRPLAAFDDHTRWVCAYRPCSHQVITSRP